MRRLLGVITRGSLTEGLEMKLADDCSIEDIKAGKFVVVDGDKLRFFSLITDVRLDATNPAVLQNPPDVTDDLVREVLSGTATYATVTLKPMPKTISIAVNANRAANASVIVPTPRTQKVNRSGRPSCHGG